MTKTTEVALSTPPCCQPRIDSTTIDLVGLEILLISDDRNSLHASVQDMVVLAAWRLAMSLDEWDITARGADTREECWE